MATSWEEWQHLQQIQCQSWKTMVMSHRYQHQAAWQTAIAHRKAVPLWHQRHCHNNPPVANAIVDSLDESLQKINHHRQAKWDRVYLVCRHLAPREARASREGDATVAEVQEGEELHYSNLTICRGTC